VLSVPAATPERVRSTLPNSSEVITGMIDPAAAPSAVS
jgi:hypothetical protein